MGNKNKSTLMKDAIILFVITLLAGLGLGLVYEVTKNPIAEANAKAKQEAYQRVYPDAKEFAADEAIEKKVKDSAQFLSNNGLDGAVISEVLIANDESGNGIGYVVSFVAKEGYGGDISLSMGMTNEGEITGLEVLSASETAGLGANCTKADFKDQFKGKNVNVIEYIKDGAKDGALADNQIDAISGATITTKAVTKGVNAAIAFLKQNVMQG